MAGMKIKDYTYHIPIKRLSQDAMQISYVIMLLLLLLLLCNPSVRNGHLQPAISS